MQDLQIVEYKKIRVLTTKQVAEAYGATAKKISNNFNANRKRYEEGKHYIRLFGDEKRQFINRPEFQDSSNRAKYLYLWTERGALLLAKSINTNTAWEAYEHLVDFYFEKKQETTKEELSEIHGMRFPEQASVLAPRRNGWHDQNRDLIQEACKKHGISHKTLYRYILSRLGRTYDIYAAREIYKRDKGYYPEYSIDIVGYFPELSTEADKILKFILEVGYASNTSPQNQ